MKLILDLANLELDLDHNKTEYKNVEEWTPQQVGLKWLECHCKTFLVSYLLFSSYAFPFVCLVFSFGRTILRHHADIHKDSERSDRHAGARAP
jgi:hypothetical protein